MLETASELHSFLEFNCSYCNQNKNNDIVVFRDQEINIDQYELSENIFLSDNKRDSEIITIEN